MSSAPPYPSIVLPQIGDYAKPSWLSLECEQVSNATEEQRDEWLAEAKRVDRLNRSIADARRLRWTTAIALVREQDHNAAERLQSITPPNWNPPSYVARWEFRFCQVLQLRAEQAERQRVADAARALELKRYRAVLWLAARGKQPDDYTDPIACANKIAVEEEIARRTADARAHGPITFLGQNCDDCAGWDGESHRCSCTNRRVAWEVGSDDFEAPSVYAAAY